MIKWNQMKSNECTWYCNVHNRAYHRHCMALWSTKVHRTEDITPFKSTHQKRGSSKSWGHGVMASPCLLWHQTTNKDGVRKRIPIHPYHLGGKTMLHICSIFVAMCFWVLEWRKILEVNQNTTSKHNVEPQFCVAKLWRVFKRKAGSGASPRHQRPQIPAVNQRQVD